MMRRILSCAAAVATAAACLVAVAPGPPAGAATVAAAAPSSVIKHVIVVMQSGHSFDNYFGTRPGVSKIPAGVCVPLAVGSTNCIKPYHLKPDQSRAGLTDTLRATQVAINGGKMNGFVVAQPNATIGATSVGNLQRQDLPYYWSLADRFTLYDNFFATSRAGALPNRVAAVSGQDAGLTTNTPPIGGITTPTVFDQLDQAHIGWKYYVQGYQKAAQNQGAALQAKAPLLAMPAVTGNADRAKRVVDTSQYYDDLVNGTLPPVSYITGTVNSERSPLNPALGEFFVKSLINALMQSPDWKNTVLLLTYDDAGGWYDHAAPPIMGGVAQGVRVPALMVSPFSKVGGVEHGEMNTTAIPGLIDRVFGLPYLTPQVSTGGDLLNGVNLHQPLIAPLIAPLSRGALVAPRPDVFIVYALYLLALCAAVLLFGYAFRRYRYAGLTVDESDDVAVTPKEYRRKVKPSISTGQSGGYAAEADPLEPTVAMARLFDLAHEPNPYDAGTPEHDAWQQGHDGVPMSSANESGHSRVSSECSANAKRLLAKKDSIAAAIQLGKAAAHSEAIANLAQAKQFDARTLGDDVEFSPRESPGVPLVGSAWLSYSQGYALGKTEGGQVDDPAAYMERARANWESVPSNKKSQFYLSKGRFEGAKQAVADVTVGLKR